MQDWALILAAASAGIAAAIFAWGLYGAYVADRALKAQIDAQCAEAAQLLTSPQASYQTAVHHSYIYPDHAPSNSITIGPGDDFNAAMTALQPGETLFVQGGTYHVADLPDVNLDAGHEEEEMAWTISPVTTEPGQLVTAAAWNDAIVENNQFYYAPPLSLPPGAQFTSVGMATHFRNANGSEQIVRALPEPDPEPLVLSRSRGIAFGSVPVGR